MSLEKVMEYMKTEGDPDDYFALVDMLKEDQTDSIDPLYFTPGEFFKGIRLLYNEMDFVMFKNQLFPEPHHTVEYIHSYFTRWGTNPFNLWCMLDEEKRKALEFLVYECAKKEAQREGVVA